MRTFSVHTQPEPATESAIGQLQTSNKTSFLSFGLENELVKVKAELALQDSSDDSIRGKIKACAESYGIDPYLAIAISRHETGNWTSDLCIKNNNFGGMRGSDDWYSYDTIDLGIEAFCKMLKDYKDNGMGTINTMANTYCGDNSSHWINSVEYFYEKAKYGN